MYQVYSSISEEQATTSPSPPPPPPAAGAVNRHAAPASSRWLRLRLHAGSGGGGRRLLPSALLGHRRRPSSVTGRRDYGVDELTDAVFHEFLRHDPQLDVRPSPLLVVQSLDADSTAARHQARPGSGGWPLTAHVEENEVSSGSGSAQRTLSNCRSTATRNASDAMTTPCRDST